MGDSLEATMPSMGSEQPPSVEPEAVAIIDFDNFSNYLRKAITVLLPEDDMKSFGPLNAALEDSVNQDCIRKFISDPQTQALYIQRNCFKGRGSVGGMLTYHVISRRLLLRAGWACSWERASQPIKMKVYGQS